VIGIAGQFPLWSRLQVGRFDVGAKPTQSVERVVNAGRSAEGDIAESFRRARGAVGDVARDLKQLRGRAGTLVKKTKSRP
jgi:hypothetical protein